MRRAARSKQVDDGETSHYQERRRPDGQPAPPAQAQARQARAEEGQRRHQGQGPAHVSSQLGGAVNDEGRAAQQTSENQCGSAATAQLVPGGGDDGDERPGRQSEGRVRDPVEASRHHRVHAQRVVEGQVRTRRCVDQPGQRDRRRDQQGHETGTGAPPPLHQHRDPGGQAHDIDGDQRGCG